MATPPLGTLVLVWQGVPLNFAPYAKVAVVQPVQYDEPVTDAEAKPVLDEKGQPKTKKTTLTEQLIAMGPVAVLEPIKNLLAREYRRATRITGGEVMTHPAATATPSLSVSAAVVLLDDSGVGLLAVVVEERLVGTLSRRDLLKCLSATPTSDAWRSDADLIAAMQERMA